MIWGNTAKPSTPHPGRGAAGGSCHSGGLRELFRQRDIAGAFAVAGHHGGLPDGGSAADSPDQSTLMGRMQRKTEECGAFHQEIRLPEYTEDNRTRRDGYTASCYIRMLYSCLVDADFLDTEQFMSDGTVRRGGHEGWKYYGNG